MNTTRIRTDDRKHETNAPRGGVPVLCERLDGEVWSPDDLDLVYDVLSNHRRRQMLQILESEPNDSATIPDLASRIAAWEMDIDRPDAVSYDDRKSVQSTIYQHHAPKMAEAGLVEFDKRTSRLELGDRSAHLELTGDDADVDGVVDGEGGEGFPDAAAVAGAVTVAVSVAATATAVGPPTAAVVLVTSVVTGAVARSRSDP